MLATYGSAMLSNTPTSARFGSELARFTRKVSKHPRASGCWHWTGSLTSLGYGQMRFRGRLTMAHRIAWLLGHDEIPPGMCVCHKCDNRRCVNPEHLWLGTMLDNQHDMSAKGRCNPRRGENHPHRKLTVDQVRGMRQLRSEGATFAQLGIRYGISAVNAQNVVNRKTWHHVD